jgi:serine/threonine-protein kinase
MGEVWKALDTRLDRIVAIKRLKGEHTARFQREARAIAALNHPNICALHDVGPDFLVMEYVDGCPLKGPWPAQDVVRVALQIAEALIEAHQRGILHRDIKPANILVTAKGAVKVLDFGLAKLDEDVDSVVTRTGQIIGTPLYMSPEQAEGNPADQRSDIFSFGAVLYEMASGRRAFESLAAVLRDDPPGLTSPLQPIVARCLAKQPTGRYRTMVEVAAALQAVRGVEPKSSIAVLPFVDMSPAKDNEYFSDGLAEEIINALAQVPDLKVIARTSAFAFKGQNTDIRRIAEILGVANILEGSVRKAGARIRITAQLITASDGTHLWSRRYDREMNDVFAIQDEIANAIADALRVQLTPEHRRHTPNLAAYEAFLKGRHHWAKLTPAALARSRECYEQAIALDPQFALARAALADHYFALTTNGLLPSSEARRFVREGALTALEIDPNLVEAQALLGLFAANVDFDWNEAVERFRHATARGKVPPEVHFFRSSYLAQIGRYKEAIEEAQRALDDDPLHLLCRTHLAYYLHETGNSAEAFGQLQQVLDIDEDFWVANWFVGLFEVLRGNLAEARTAADRAYRSWNNAAAGLLAGIMERQGDLAAKDLVAQLGSPLKYGVPLGLSVYELARGETERAADWLCSAVEHRDSRAIYLLPYMRSSSHWPRLARLANLEKNEGVPHDDLKTAAPTL